MTPEERILYGPSGQPYSTFQAQGESEETGGGMDWQSFTESPESFREAAAGLPSLGRMSPEEERARLLATEERSTIAQEEILSKVRREEAEEEKRLKELREKKEAEAQQTLARERELERLEARRKQSLREAGATKFQKAERFGSQVGKVAGLGYKAATLGGPVRMSKKAISTHYIPSAQGMGAGSPPSAIAGGISPSAIGKPLREVSTPSLGRLRGAGTPGLTSTSMSGPSIGVGGTLIAQVARGAMTFGQVPRQEGIGVALSRLRSAGTTDSSTLAMLRGMTFPRGLTEQEMFAYKEIKENGDIDIPSHIIQDLEGMGIDRNDAVKAINGLLQKGHVKHTGQFQGEPVLEVIR